MGKCGAGVSSSAERSDAFTHAHAATTGIRTRHPPTLSKDPTSGLPMMSWGERTGAGI